MNSVDSLVFKPLSLPSDEEKLSFKNLGRPKPPINLTQATKHKNREFTKRVNLKLWKKHKWLGGC